MAAITKTGEFTDWVSDLARKHTRVLARVAAHEGLQGEYALDAVQEAFATFLKLPEARALSNNPEESFALLATIVRNVSRNLRRRHHLARPHLVLEDTVLTDAGPSVDQLIGQAEEHVALLGCIEKLAEVQRLVVALRVIEEMSGADTANALRLTPGCVAVVLHRAKSELKRCLSQ